MMNYLSLSRKPETHQSAVWLSSKTHPRVRFAIKRMSFGRRVAVATAIRDAGQRLEFSSAGGGLADKAERSIAEAEIERIYLRCGLGGLEGLEIDGSAADVECLFECGPEDLTREILEAIKSEWYVSEAERKN